MELDLKSYTSDRNNTGGKILYFEDNVSNIELVEEIIINHRPEISLIRSRFGKNATRIATEHAPDLILLDLDLPDIYGYKVLLNLQSDAKTKSIPVVVVSAVAISRQIDKLLEAGAKNYLTKPIEVTGFLKMIDEWIGNKGDVFTNN